MFSCVVRRLAVVLLAATPFSPSLLAAQSHRLMALDIGTRAGSEHHRLRVLDVESGEPVAEHQLGWMSSIAVSANGDLVAAWNYSRGVHGSRLKILRAGDLTVLQSGLLRPFPRHEYQQGAGQDMAFSPDERHLLLQSPEGRGDLGRTKLIRLTRELDDEGYFKIQPANLFGKHPPELLLRGTTFVQFLRQNEWPRTHIWNWRKQTLEVLDLGTGEISRRPLAQSPSAADTDRWRVEDSSDGPQVTSGRGSVVTGMQSTTAYFIPRPSRRRPDVTSCTASRHLVKVDLTTDPPQIIRRSEQPHANLRPIAAACEPADKLFVLHESENDRRRNEPSTWVKIFRTSDLAFEREIELPLDDCHRLAVSLDAKYLYALDTVAARLAVIDVATLQISKVLEDELGDYPLLIFPLPSD